MRRRPFARGVIASEEEEMPVRVSRREFLARTSGTVAATVAASLPGHALMDPLFAPRDAFGDQAIRGAGLALTLNSPFRVAVINDEISQDFGRACEVASQKFGMEWIELRGMWNKNIVKLDAHDISESQRILKKYQLRVTDIASPLFKVDWKGAPKSKFSPKQDQFNADFTFEQQGEVLERSIELAKIFDTDRIRCFDFWRLDDPAPYRAAINETLRDAAEKAGKQGRILVLENEPSCNTATGAEAANVLSSVQSRFFMLNWDPGNAAGSGERPYPDG